MEENVIFRIELNEEQTPMWFLQDETHNIHLTYMSKGPVEVDFGKLSEENKDYLYSSITGGFVSPVDVSLEEVVKTYLGVKEQKRQKINQETPQEVVDYNKKIKKAEEEIKVTEAILKQQKQQLKNEEKFRLLLEGSTRATKNGISRENNIHNLLKLLDLERSGKNRKMVKSYIEKKISSIKKSIYNKIENESVKGSKLSEKEKQMIGDIEREESEYLEFVIDNVTSS